MTEIYCKDLHGAIDLINSLLDKGYSVMIFREEDGTYNITFFEC